MKLPDSHATFENDRSAEFEIDPVLIRQELDRILKSRHFRLSKRSRQFLQFVVEAKIRGNDEEIKERLIGVQVFGRDVDYATGDDSVVRVQAGEVRRRLEMYQADVDGRQQVSIELPLGSYVPVFHLCNPGLVGTTITAPETEQEPTNGAEKPLVLPPISAEAPLSQSNRVIASPNSYQTDRSRKFRMAAIGFCGAVVLLASGIAYGIWSMNSPAAWMRAFWGPVLGTGKPVLICVGKPAVYQPSAPLFGWYSAKHPGAFATLLERYTRVLPFDAEEMIRWGDMEPVRNPGPAIGGVRAAVNIGALLGRHDVPFAIRSGDEATFSELRENPAVIVGAQNTRWMAEMSAELHFVMRETNGRLVVQETGPKGRTWGNQGIPEGWQDYALITRQLKGPTGQFTVKLEGISDRGTQAGSEVVSDPENLRAALRGLPKGWQNKNIQLVIETDIIGDKPSPPKTIAFYVW